MADLLLSKVKTVNPLYGCSLNPPCPYCYMRRLNLRFRHTPDFGIPTEMPQALKGFHTIKPTNIFFTSASDMADYTEEWREVVFDEMVKFPKNVYMFLTKRPKMCAFDGTYVPKLWAGVSVTGPGDTKRIQEIQRVCKAPKYWVTIEPLLADPTPTLNLSGISWIVIGAETGNRSGKVVPQKDWIVGILEKAREKKIPVCMKESLLDIIGPDLWCQELPKDFN